MLATHLKSKPSDDIHFSFVIISQQYTILNSKHTTMKTRDQVDEENLLVEVVFAASVCGIYLGATTHR
jgi:hypothetical protein